MRQPYHITTTLPNNTRSPLIREYPAPVHASTTYQYMLLLKLKISDITMPWPHLRPTIQGARPTQWPDRTLFLRVSVLFYNGIYNPSFQHILAPPTPPVRRPGHFSHPTCKWILILPDVRSVFSCAIRTDPAAAAFSLSLHQILQSFRVGYVVCLCPLRYGHGVVVCTSERG